MSKEKLIALKAEYKAYSSIQEYFVPQSKHIASRFAQKQMSDILIEIEKIKNSSMQNCQNDVIHKKP